MAQKIRVCIWDEDSESRAGMLRVLGNLDDYQVTEYRSGAGGIANLENLRPQILLLDVDYTIAEPDKLVPELRKSLPDLKIIALGKRWDEGSRQRFNELGFDAMLLKPLDVESFQKAVQTANQSSVVKSNCQVLSFFSPKGKSGRTTLIVNLALALARVSGEKVGIIDAETNFADMDAFLNLNPRSTIVEALRDLTYLTGGTLEKYFEEVSDKVFVLCGANTPQQAAFVEPEGLTKLINLARPNFRYLLVDLAPGFNPISIAAAEASEKVYLTTMAGGTFEIKHLQRAMEIFKSLDNWQQRVGCIITRMAPDVRRAKELEELIGCPVTLIPNEYLLCSEAANNGRMAVDIGSGSPLTQQIDRMAFAINGEGGEKMLLISIVAALVIFLVFLAIYNSMTQSSVQVSQRVRRIGEVNRQRARSGGDGGFWDDFNSSRMSTWAKAGANRFGRFFPKRAWFDMHVERAALPVTGSEYATITFFGGLFWFFLMLIVNGSIIRSFVICVAWWLVASYYLYNLGQKRIKAFNAQLGDAIVMMSNAVKAGFTFQQAMDIVAKEMNDPISTEFNRAINEVQLGVPLEDALNAISRRITSDDFDLVATAVIIQRQVGGNLTHILDTVGQTIRERIKLNGEIKSLTAEGVMSGWIIGLLPVALAGFFLMLDPHYFDEFLQASFGKTLVIVAVVSEIIGGLVIKKIVNVRI